MLFPEKSQHIVNYKALLLKLFLLSIKTTVNGQCYCKTTMTKQLQNTTSCLSVMCMFFLQLKCTSLSALVGRVLDSKLRDPGFNPRSGQV